MPLHDRAAKSELPECYYVGGSCLKWDLRPDLSHGGEESEVPECYSISALELSRSIMHRYLQTMGFKKERKKENGISPHRRALPLAPSDVR
jgi:hypothetical protein